MGLLAVCRTMLFDDMPEGWDAVLHVTLGSIVDRLDRFYADEQNLEYPLYKALLLKGA